MLKLWKVLDIVYKVESECINCKKLSTMIYIIQNSGVKKRVCEHCVNKFPREGKRAPVRFTKEDKNNG